MYSAARDKYICGYVKHRPADTMQCVSSVICNFLQEEARELLTNGYDYEAAVETMMERRYGDIENEHDLRALMHAVCAACERARTAAAA